MRFGNNKREVIHKHKTIYESIASASIATSIPKTTISSQLRNGKGDWLYKPYTELKDEVFIKHPFLDDIECSNIGRIRRSNGVITVGSKRSDGYMYFHHFRSKRNYSIHRLIYESWCGEIESVIHHMDDNKTNNAICNLMDCTQKENVRYSL